PISPLCPQARNNRPCAPTQTDWNADRAPRRGQQAVSPGQLRARTYRGRACRRRPVAVLPGQARVTSSCTWRQLFMFARLVNQFWKNRAIVNRERPAQPRRVLLECERLEAREVLATLTVGPGRQFATIQAAVNAAHNSGDTINVFNSTYQEQVVL